MAEQNSRNDALGFCGGIVAAVIVVKGLMATIPDAILLDLYGDVHGFLQLGLAVAAVTTFSVAWRWIARAS